MTSTLIKITQSYYGLLDEEAEEAWQKCETLQDVEMDFVRDEVIPSDNLGAFVERLAAVMIRLGDTYNEVGVRRELFKHQLPELNGKRPIDYIIYGDTEGYKFDDVLLWATHRYENNQEDE